jgi:hypothetical protein
MADTHGSSTERPAMLSPTSSCSAAAAGSREVGTGGLAGRAPPSLSVAMTGVGLRFWPVGSPPLLACRVRAAASRGAQSVVASRESPRRASGGVGTRRDAGHRLGRAGWVHRTCSARCWPGRVRSCALPTTSVPRRRWRCKLGLMPSVRRGGANWWALLTEMVSSGEHH